MKNGLLLINVGTPKSPDAGSIRTWLREFLADKRVVDLSAVLRYTLLYAFILPFRPRKSQKGYQAIWTDRGAPLLVYSQDLVSAVQKTLGDNWKVALGMRYGDPCIEQALLTLEECTSITVIPLYPQYASASTGSALEKVFQMVSRKSWIPPLHIVHNFYENSLFISALTSSIQTVWNGSDHILFSYHGLPERHLHKTGCHSICTDPCLTNPVKNHACYRAQCFKTSDLVANNLRLASSQHSTAFQSRLGKTPWIKPFTDEILHALRNKGIQNLLVACPSFVTDCLETLEEIGIRARNQWIEAGGHTFTLVPCLNSNAEWVQTICFLAQSSKPVFSG